nr:LuxR family transcriptional regulator [Bacillota bacterium]
MYERPQPEWYVLTKFAPPMVRAHTVHRPHLDQMLRHSVSAYSLTLLSAPAGYGKTTLLSSLPVLLPDYPLAWISLDEEDNDPVRFIGLLAAALGKIHPRCGQSVLSHLRGGISNRADLRKISAALINDVLHYISEPFALVLDDLHFVTEPLVYNVLDHLLEQSPPNLHLAIGTRTDPPLRLGRLAARGQLGEFRRGDLSLNLEQTRHLMNQILDLDLSLAETRT